jgi:hypothetical protein
MKIFSALYQGVTVALKKVGDVVSTIVLVIFYFTIFALFAVPARCFSDFFKKKATRTTFVIPSKKYETIEQFSNEG